MASQVVTSPTTAKGTLTDHIYWNSLSDYSKLHIQVQDTYYGDHDTLYYFIPLMLN